MSDTEEIKKRALEANVPIAYVSQIKDIESCSWAATSPILWPKGTTTSKGQPRNGSDDAHSP